MDETKRMGVLAAVGTTIGFLAFMPIFSAEPFGVGMYLRPSLIVILPIIIITLYINIRINT
ncbi:hypothetical protein [Natrinema amylolyticum]|uniref:hypothetical protein n=1 Tax=Natrinema amylolyticum TaxID=2878679 RepID=UPI001CF9A6A8|nr:hypothetical protein [Natrinema amylolyticum]